MPTPDELQSEMETRDAIRRLREQMDTHVEGIALIAQTVRAYYDALIEQRFSAAQALALTVAYQYAMIGGGKGGPG